MFAKGGYHSVNGKPDRVTVLPLIVSRAGGRPGNVIPDTRPGRMNKKTSSKWGNLREDP